MNSSLHATPPCPRDGAGAATASIAGLRSAIALLSGLLFGLGCASAWGAWYQIEVIVFQFNDPGTLEAERWPANPGAPRLDGATELLAPSDTGQAYTQLRPQQLALGGVWSRLRSASEYTPLLHVGWRQPVHADASGLPVHIHGGKQYRVEGLPEWEVDGTVQVARRRFLQVDVDLLDRRLVPAPGLTGGQGLQSFRIHQQRRMRSQELHYLDNPEVGALVLLSPFGVPDPAE